jgi:dihydrofolate synthase / folylpolyglutamate synthase
MADSFSRQFGGHSVYSKALQSSLKRLDTLVNWESLMRVRGSQRLMRTSVKPAAVLLEAVSSPQNSFRAVHVTGSKGKGSVSILVGTGLNAAGFRTGVYGSPHVERVNERIRLANLEPIGDDDLAAVLDCALDARAAHAVDATWFDVMSVAGMLAFRTAGTDWGVVEVGMGGRLDSTNVLNAPVAVVTNISLEHRDIIGPTIREIAYEKAGIFSRGCQPIVGMSSTHELATVFVTEAARVGAENPIFVPPDMESSIQAHNVALARCAIGAALRDYDPVSLLPDSAVDSSLALLPARMELFSLGAKHFDDDVPESLYVHVLLDGAHVSDSVRRVLLEAKPQVGANFVVLLAVGREKDAVGICSAIKDAEPAKVVLTQVSHDRRYLQANELCQEAMTAGLEAIEVVQDPINALQTALANAVRARCNLVIIGSLHLAGRLRPFLTSLRESAN